MKWIALHAIREDSFEFIPCQSAERRRRFPEMSDEVCLKSLQLVLSHNQILSGDIALPEILSRLRGFGWLAILFRVPVIKLLLHVVYHWIANNRYIISHTIKPLCEE
jgi:predicted DCC family thiol-disulfide oxidoreductase YuxK